MKKWYQSKTIWLNIIALLLAFLPAIDETVLASLGIENTQAYLTVLGLVTGFLNLVLRTISGGQMISTKKRIRKRTK